MISYLVRVVAVAIALVATSFVYGQQLEVNSIPGRSAQASISDGIVSVENIRLTNPRSSARTTGTLYVSLRVTAGSDSTSLGYHLFDVNDHRDVRGLFDIRRLDGITDSSLSPGRYLNIHRVRLRLRQPPAGTYYVHFVVYQWDSSLRDNGGRTQIGSLTFTRQWTFGNGGGGDDHGNSRSSATAAALPSATSGRIETGQDVDFFRFQVPSRGSVEIRTSGSLDTLGALYDSSGTRLATNDDSGSGYNFRIVRTLSAGTYYVAVQSYGSGTGAYTLHLGGGGDGCAPPL